MSWVGRPLPREAKVPGPRAYRLLTLHKENSATTRKSYLPLGPHPGKESESQAMDWEKLHARHNDKGLVFKIYQELSEVSKYEQNPIKIWAKIWIDISSDTWLAKKHIKKVRR